LQCVAVCCSVLQCVAVCCSVLQYVAVCCSVLQCVAVCCSVGFDHSPATPPRPLPQPRQHRDWITCTWSTLNTLKETYIYTKRDPHKRPTQPQQHRDWITCTWDTPNTPKETCIHMKRDLQNRPMTDLIHTHTPHMWEKHRYEWNETCKKELDIWK